MSSRDHDDAARRRRRRRRRARGARPPPAPLEAVARRGRRPRRGRARPAAATTMLAGRYQRVEDRAMSSRVMRLDRGLGRRATSRPSGWSGNSASARSGVDEVVGRVVVMRSSSRITWRSASTSSGRKARRRRARRRGSRAPRSTAVGRHPRVERGVLLGRERVHVAADASRPPRRSRGPCASSVPLNSRCSRKWRRAATARRARRARRRRPRRRRATERASGIALGDDAQADGELRSARSRWISARSTAAAGAPPLRPPPRRPRSPPPVAAGRRPPARCRGRRPGRGRRTRSRASASKRVLEATTVGRRPPAEPALGGAAGPRVAPAGAARPPPSAPSSPSPTGRQARPCRWRRCRRRAPRSRRRARARPRPGRCACRRPSLEMCTQAVAAREDVDERTELGDVHDPAGVDLAELGRRRVEDQLDLRAWPLRPRRRRSEPIVTMPTHAVVVDRDVGAGLLLDRVDDLALGPDDLADLVDRDLEADDLRRGRRAPRRGARRSRRS